MPTGSEKSNTIRKENVVRALFITLCLTLSIPVSFCYAGLQQPAKPRTSRPSISRPTPEQGSLIVAAKNGTLEAFKDFLRGHPRSANLGLLRSLVYERMKESKEDLRPEWAGVLKEVERAINQFEDREMDLYSKGTKRPSFQLNWFRPTTPGAPEARAPKATLVALDDLNIKGPPRATAILGGFYDGDGVLRMPNVLNLVINLFYQGKAGWTVPLARTDGGLAGFVFLRDDVKVGAVLPNNVELDNTGFWASGDWGASRFSGQSLEELLPMTKASVWRFGRAVAEDADPGFRLRGFTIKGDKRDPMTFAFLEAGLTYVSGSGVVSDDSTGEILFSKKALDLQSK